MYRYWPGNQEILGVHVSMKIGVILLAWFHEPNSDNKEWEQDIEHKKIPWLQSSGVYLKAQGKTQVLNTPTLCVLWESKAVTIHGSILWNHGSQDMTLKHSQGTVSIEVNMGETELTQWGREQPSTRHHQIRWSVYVIAYSTNWHLLVITNISLKGYHILFVYSSVHEHLGFNFELLWIMSHVILKYKFVYMFSFCWSYTATVWSYNNLNLNLESLQNLF